MRAQIERNQRDLDITPVTPSDIGLAGKYEWSGTYVRFNGEVLAELQVVHLNKGTFPVRDIGRMYVSDTGRLLDLGLSREKMLKAPSAKGVYSIYTVENETAKQVSLNPDRLAMSAWSPETSPTKNQAIQKDGETVASFQWGGNIQAKNGARGAQKIAQRAAEATRVIDGVTHRKCNGECGEFKPHTVKFFRVTGNKDHPQGLGCVCLECDTGKQDRTMKSVEESIKPLRDEPTDMFEHRDPQYELNSELVIIDGQVFAPVPESIPMRGGARFIQRNMYFMNFDGTKVFSKSNGMSSTMGIQAHGRVQVSFVRSDDDRRINSSAIAAQVVVEIRRALLCAWYPNSMAWGLKYVRNSVETPCGARDLEWSRAMSDTAPRAAPTFNDAPLDVTPVTIQDDHPIYGPANGEYIGYNGKQWAIVNQVMRRQGDPIESFDRRYAVDGTGMEVLILKTFNSAAKKGTVLRAQLDGNKCILSLSVPGRGQCSLSARSVALSSWFPGSIPEQTSLAVGSPTVWDMEWRPQADILQERSARGAQSIQDSAVERNVRESADGAKLLQCWDCGQFKPMDLDHYFHDESREHGYSQGLQPWCKTCQLAYDKDKYGTDELYRYRKNQRARVYQVIDRCGRGELFEQLLGCNWDTFRGHIESQWEPGMTWDNRGVYRFGMGDKEVWHIDHIKALKDCTTKKEVDDTLKYTNTRPMWATANMKRTRADYDEASENFGQNKKLRA